jgi:6-phosphogluconolactonase
VGAYQINLRTGLLFTSNNALAWIGNKAKTGVQPNVLLFNPAKTTAFVADSGSNDIASYSVNHDGSLAAGPVTALKAPATNPTELAMDPGGKFLFVADQGVPQDPNCGAKGTNQAECHAGISVFSVSGGALTEVPGSPFPVLTQQQVTSFPAPVIPAGIAVSNSGNFLYVTDQANDIVLGFSFDGTSGGLTPLPSTTAPALWPVVVGSAPSGVFSPPIGNFLYVTNAVSNNIFEFKIQGDGALTTVVGSPVSAGVGPTTMFSDPVGKYMFAVGTQSNQLLGYRINQVTGALTALTPAFVSTGATPVAGTIRSNDVVNGDYWIVVSDYQANAVTTIQFINSTGAMSVLPQLVGPVAPFGIGSR